MSPVVTPPDNLPAIELPMTRTQARRMAWTGFSLLCVSVTASILSTAGFLPTLGTQICGALAAITSALSYLFMRQAPSAAGPNRT